MNASTIITLIEKAKMIYMMMNLQVMLTAMQQRIILHRLLLMLVTSLTLIRNMGMGMPQYQLLTHNLHQHSLLMFGNVLMAVMYQKWIFTTAEQLLSDCRWLQWFATRGSESPCPANK